MRFFICIIGRETPDIPVTVCRRYESLPRSRGISFEWTTIAGVPIMVAGDDIEGPQFAAQDDQYVAVGTARLDNRPDLEQWSASPPGQLSDLALALQMVVRHGARSIPRILGDFAFVVWHAATRTGVAACDTFAVRRLFYAARSGVLAFSSRAESLALDDRYEIQYFGELVAVCAPSPGLTAFAGVKAVPAASMVVFDDSTLSTREYWSAYNFPVQPTWARKEHEAAAICRELFVEAVRLRISGTNTWSLLSGGIDSSSVVSVAQWLAANGTIPSGLDGTVTWVDTHGTGADERRYSNAVVSRWRVRNETIVDPPIWFDERYEPPLLDRPGMALVHYPRESRICAMVREPGGRVLLTGTAGDVLFGGNMFFFADWIAQGRVAAAMREMAHRAAIGRVSFWELAYRNAFLPLLPRALQQYLVRDAGQIPAWVLDSTIREFSLDKRSLVHLVYAGRIGSKYHDAIAATVSSIGPMLTYGLNEETLDVRHPFLYRPLVEFALQLPPELCVRPNARKWIFREAMKGILPDIVRTRVGKGSVYGLLSWFAAAEGQLLEQLIENPILEQLGAIDGGKLRAAFAVARQEQHSRLRVPAAIHEVLAIEAWLQLRSGRWPRGSHGSRRTSAG